MLRATPTLGTLVEAGELLGDDPEVAVVAVGADPLDGDDPELLLADVVSVVPVVEETLAVVVVGLAVLWVPVPPWIVMVGE